MGTTNVGEHVLALDGTVAGRGNGSL